MSDAFSETLGILMALSITAAAGAWLEFARAYLAKYYPKIKINESLRARFAVALLFSIVFVVVYIYSKDRYRG